MTQNPLLAYFYTKLCRYCLAISAMVAFLDLFCSAQKSKKLFKPIQRVTTHLWHIKPSCDKLENIDWVILHPLT